MYALTAMNTGHVYCLSLDTPNFHCHFCCSTPIIGIMSYQFDKFNAVLYVDDYLICQEFGD